jgi:hypothetical protein
MCDQQHIDNRRTPPLVTTNKPELGHQRWKTQVKKGVERLPLHCKSGKSKLKTLTWFHNLQF